MFQSQPVQLPPAYSSPIPQRLYHSPSPALSYHSRIPYYSPQCAMEEYAPPLPGTHQPGPSSYVEPSSTFSSPYLAAASSFPAIPPSANYPTQHPPNLVRIQPQVFANMPLSNSQSPNPSGTDKATVQLAGDVMSMNKGWTQEEWFSRRRLVQFWRRQEGSVIQATFRPLPQADYLSAQGSIIVSCIFREDLNACFITSVDMIYLLEALVGSRFTVEEKNRIRRNLEGLRPVTVSKHKPGSEDFFRLIMGFPNPKPRNIEKDIKVFPWEVVEAAVRKIISKYSANYANTRSATMSSSPLVQPSPLMSFPTMPTPLQHVTSDQGFGMENASASAPQLISHSSSDSSNYAQSSTYSMHNPQTPQLDQSDNTYIPTSAMHIEKHEDLGERSQPHDSPYVSPPQRTYWEGTVDPSAMASAPYNEYGERVKTNDSPYAPPQDQNYWDGAVDAQGMPSQTYGMMPMQYQDQSAHLPHVHAGASQRPSSMDLKVMYPNMQRKPTPP